MVPCLSDCGQYIWVAEPWSVWKVSNVDLKDNCGEGVQTRKVRCMLNTIDGPSEQVEDYLCDPEDMPLGARTSRLPCPEDCVLSDWGAWSSCPLVRMAFWYFSVTWESKNSIYFNFTTYQYITKLSHRLSLQYIMQRNEPLLSMLSWMLNFFRLGVKYSKRG